MLVSLIKKKFFTLWDYYQSAAISNTKLNDFFWDAQNQVYTDLTAKYQLTNIVTNDTVYLIKQVPLTISSNLINIETQIAAGDFSSLVNIKPTYIKSGITYSFTAVPLLAEDENSFYSQGSVNAPRYKMYSDASSQRILELLPAPDANTTITAALITYFINPIDIDFVAPDYDIPYTDNAIDNIIKKAIQLASASFHDQEGFNTSSTLLTEAIQNP